MTVRELIIQIHSDNVERGWWDGFNDLPLDIKDRSDVACVIEKLCLIHSEISEALEEVRNGKGFDEIYFDKTKPLGFPTELADAVIRIFDLAVACGFDIESVISMKLTYNRTRGHKHGGKML